MKVNVPTLGTELALSEDWTFTLHAEYRNYDFWAAVSDRDYPYGNADGSISVTLPAGSKLKVDRIFIRRGAGDYDSMTFWLVDCPNKEWAPKKVGGTATNRLRFWVKLDDANDIVYE